MIASLRGTLAHVGPDHLVIECAGVGYLVFAPRPLLGALGPVGEPCFLFTMLIVREDSMTLYGFASREQRALFESFLSVSGVGPKVALSLLSAGEPDEIRAAIAHSDTARLARVPGIGKTAAAVNNELAELLVSLGYSVSEAASAIAALPADAPSELEERLRLALRHFGSA